MKAERKECWIVYAVGWNWLRTKAKEGMVAGESKRRGKEIGRSAGACMLWGGIWLRAKAKDHLALGHGQGRRGISDNTPTERYVCLATLAHRGARHEGVPPH